MIEKINNKHFSKKYHLIIWLLFVIQLSLNGQQHKADSCFDAANQLLQSGNYKQAAVLFAQSVRYEKNSPTPRLQDLYYEAHNAAVCFGASNQEDSATTYYLTSYKAIDDLGKKNEAAYILQQLAQLKKQNNNYGSALQYLNQSDSINNLNALYNCKNNFLRGAIHLEKKDLNGVKAFLNDSIRFKENCTLYYQNLLYKYKIETSNYSEAAAILTSLIDTADNTNFLNKEELIFDLGNCYNELRLFEQSLSAFDQAFSVFESKGNYKAAIHSLSGKNQALLELNKITESLNLSYKIEAYSKQFNYDFGIASAYFDFGQAYSKRSDYDKAIEYFIKSYTLFNKAGLYEYSSFVMNSAAVMYMKKGEFNKAIEIFDDNLNFFKQNGDLKMQALCYNNIGGIYLEWGNKEMAMVSFQKAIEIFSNASSETTDLAMSYNNIGNIYQQNEQWKIAIEYYLKSYNHYVEANDAENQIIVLNSLGTVYVNLNEFETAEEYLMKALKIAEQFQSKSKSALLYNNIGDILIEKKDYDKAISLLKKSLDIRLQLKEKALSVVAFNNLATAYQLKAKTNAQSQNLYDSSIYYLNRGIKQIEELRNNAKDEYKLDYLSKQIAVYNNLIISYAESGNKEQVFYTIEKSKAKYLEERISKNQNLGQISLSEAQALLREDEAFLMYTSLENNAITAIVITNSSIDVKTFNREQFLRNILDNVAIKSEVISQLNFEEIQTLKKYLQTKDDNSLNYRLENKLFSNIMINYKKHLSSISYDNVLLAEEFGRELYELLISPIKSNLKNKKKLMIMPNSLLSLLPFETFIDKERKYLIETYDIMYVNSANVYHLLSQRDYSESNRQPMLAFGITDYSCTEKKASENYVDISSLQHQYYSLKTDGKTNFSSIYKELGMHSFSDLQQGNEEFQMLANSFGSIHQYKNDLVNEQQIKAMSMLGSLELYKNIHFSVHGISNGDFPELSALVMSCFGEGDGFLTVNEIQQLKINADFVTLSACNSHLGKIYKGEGVVGLSYAFLMAGANSVCASLWEVDESSTATFMYDIYNNINNKQMSRCAAINEAKRDFITGKHGFAWKLPYFWSPFILYGYSN